MLAGKKQLTEIFTNGRALEIPFFQRGYVWTEDLWERLLDDLLSICESEEPHFIGSIILKQKRTETRSGVSEIRTVVDGQQRLTSLMLLLKALLLYKGEIRVFDRQFRTFDDKISLWHNRNDKEEFEYVMSLETVDLIEEKSNISKAYNYFVNYLVNNSETAKLDFDKIVRNLWFVSIDLDDNEDEQLIFDTINSLGVQLGPHELLKNYFFDRNDEQKFDDIWVKIFEADDDVRSYWNEEIKATNKTQSVIEIFFHSYLTIKINEPSYDVPNRVKNIFSKREQLFKSYKKFIKDYQGNRPNDLLQDLASYALIFRDTFNANIVNEELPFSDYGTERLNLIIFGLGYTVLIPYVLYMEKNISCQNDKREMFEVLESYMIRRILSGTQNKGYDALFNDTMLTKQILSRKDFLAEVSTRGDGLNFPDDDMVSQGVKSKKLTSKYALGILYLMETKLRNNDRYTTQTLSMNKYSIEHVMPKKWEQHWALPSTRNDIERHSKIQLLGNLTLLTQSLNKAVSNRNWESKKNGSGAYGGLYKYAASLETFSTFLQEPYWDEEVIDKRSEFLIEKALTVWRK